MFVQLELCKQKYVIIHEFKVIQWKIKTEYQNSANRRKQNNVLPMASQNGSLWIKAGFLDLICK